MIRWGSGDGPDRGFGEGRGQMDATQMARSEAEPVLVVATLPREHIGIVSLSGEQGDEGIELVDAERERLGACSLLIIELAGRRPAPASLALIPRLRRHLAANASIALACSSPIDAEAAQAAGLGRTVVCYARVADALAAARDERYVERSRRGDEVVIGRIPPPGLRHVKGEPCYSADWL